MFLFTFCFFCLLMSSVFFCHKKIFCFVIFFIFVVVVVVVVVAVVLVILFIFDVYNT